jgi:transcriptional regulator with XRE-family HTH domain
MATKPNQALIYRKVPPFLRAMREGQELTQRELANRIGKTQWWVARIETGSRRVDIAEFIEWCDGCGIRVTTALEGLIDSSGEVRGRNHKSVRQPTAGSTHPRRVSRRRA